MAKIKGMRLHGTVEQVKAWKEESDFIGRNVSRIIEDGTCLEIFALAPKKKDRKQVEAEKEKAVRGARRGNGHKEYRNVEVDDES